MNKIRVLKKTNPQIKSAEQQSRQIINHLYMSQLDQKNTLEFQSPSGSLHLLPSTTPTSPLAPSAPYIDSRHLPQFLQHLAKTNFFIHLCSFIIFDASYMRLVSRDKTISIKRKPFSLKLLRYWLGNLYFCRIQKNMIAQMFQSVDKPQSRYIKLRTLHGFEEKLFMPDCLMMVKQQKTLIREAKISNSQEYFKDDQFKRQIFCAIYFRNGTQQLFSFRQILQFVDCREIACIKILPKDNPEVKVFCRMYSPQQLTSQTLRIKQTLVNIIAKVERWEVLRQNFEGSKDTLGMSKQYEAYGDLLMLELVVHLEQQQRIVVESLKLEWMVDQQSNFIISNVLLYRYKPCSPAFRYQPLDALYQRLHPFQPTSKSLTAQALQQNHSTLNFKLKLPHLSKFRSKTSQKEAGIDKKFSIYQNKSKSKSSQKYSGLPRKMGFSCKVQSCLIKSNNLLL